MKKNTTIRHDTSQRHAGKYTNSNPLHQLVLGRFLDTMAAEIHLLDKGSTLDFGCGEAFFWREMEQRGVIPAQLTGIDLRDDALLEARRNFPCHQFIRQDLLAWEPEKNFDLVIASQVLEHLPDPHIFLEKLTSLSSGHLLLTVPWEPFFRLANLARGRDILRLGNHPEHINLWGATDFEKFVTPHAVIIKSIRVFPFLITVCKPRQ